MTKKEILLPLVSAFLLWVIPLAFNVVTHGGLIRALDGVTRTEFEKLEQEALRADRKVAIVSETDIADLPPGEPKNRKSTITLGPNYTLTTESVNTDDGRKQLWRILPR